MFSLSNENEFDVPATVRELDALNAALVGALGCNRLPLLAENGNGWIKDDLFSLMPLSFRDSASPSWNQLISLNYQFYSYVVPKIMCTSYLTNDHRTIQRSAIVFVPESTNNGRRWWSGCQYLRIAIVSFVWCLTCIGRAKSKKLSLAKRKSTGFVYSEHTCWCIHLQFVCPEWLQTLLSSFYTIV